MLTRSLSWPVQSVISHDPREVTIHRKTGLRPTENEFLHRKDGDTAKAKPDLLPKPETHLSPLTKPDIFLTAEPKKPLSHNPESMQITFFDHYKILDSASGRRERDFVVSVSSQEVYSGLLREKVPRRSERCALACDFDGLSKSDKSVKVIIEGENGTNTKSATCRFCRFKPIQKRIPEEEINAINVDLKQNQLLATYQIDILRKNCLLSRKRNSSYDVDYFQTPNGSRRKPWDRKTTSDFESVASNETKTTECDDKSGSLRRGRPNPRRNSFHLIRSYSLGHEKSDKNLNGRYKKFSLPTPNTHLKVENDNLETGQEDKDSGTLNLALDKRKVITLTRHYYPENGWGYVIVTCSVMVNILCHGLQLSAGVIMVPAAVKFHTDLVHTGK